MMPVRQGQGVQLWQAAKKIRVLQPASQRIPVSLAALRRPEFSGTWNITANGS